MTIRKAPPIASRLREGRSEDRSTLHAAGKINPWPNRTACLKLDIGPVVSIYYPADYRKIS